MNGFYGSKNAPAELQRLYDDLLRVWAKDTCAPRLRDNWDERRKSCGQCSITAFLIQELFGGKVLGIRNEDGSYHCFNVIDGLCFDLTSEQFDKPLDYEDAVEQSRETHFAKAEKKARYELLKARLHDLRRAEGGK